MRLFLDANVLVAVLNKEYPLFTHATRVLSLGETKKFTLIASPTSIAIAFYFSSKKSGEELAKKKIGVLCSNIEISTVDQDCTTRAINDLRVGDLEDGIQYYSAIMAKCDYIITENGSDFYYSDIPTRNCKNFINHELHEMMKGG